jgi:energy-coupling factor transporter transmembrane protein EcfT
MFVGLAVRVVIVYYTWNFVTCIIAFVVFTVLRIVLPIDSRAIRRLLALLIAAAIVFAGFMISRAHYYTFFEKSHYTADYIQSLGDGNAPILHDKRDGKGTALATLTPNGKVKVNGVTRDRLEYNITTPEGLTGWVEAAAFPPDALPEKDAGNVFAIVWKQDGKLVGEGFFSFDRDLMNLQPILNERYIVADKDGNGDNVFESFRGLRPAAQRMAIPVNLAVSTKWINGQDLLEGKDPADMTENPGVQVVLKSVIYGQECTIIVVESDGIVDFNTGHSLFDMVNNDHEKFMRSLVIQDLDNSGSTPAAVLDAISYSQQANGNYAALWDIGESGIAGMALVFPPLKTRHFSLIHTEQVAEKPGFAARTGLSLLAKILKRKPENFDNYAAWDFPEVRVR